MADTLEDLRRLARELCEHEPESFSLDVLHEAGRLAKDDPAALTDGHLRHVGVYEPARVLPLLKKRADARQRRADQAFAEAQQRTANQRRVAAAANEPAIPAIDAATLEQMSLEEICERFPDVPCTMQLWGDLLKFVESMNTKNVERNERLDKLEAANQKLQERVLELEASVAAVRS